MRAHAGKHYILKWSIIRALQLEPKQDKTGRSRAWYRTGRMCADSRESVSFSRIEVLYLSIVLVHSVQRMCTRAHMSRFRIDRTGVTPSACGHTAAPHVTRPSL